MKTTIKPDIEQVNPTFYRVFYKGKVYDVNKDELVGNWIIKYSMETLTTVCDINEAISWLIKMNLWKIER